MAAVTGYDSLKYGLKKKDSFLVALAGCGPRQESDVDKGFHLLASAALAILSDPRFASEDAKAELFKRILAGPN